MSDMKYDAIVSQGIPIIDRIPIPKELLPADSMVEMAAKVKAGYYTGGAQVTDEPVHGRPTCDFLGCGGLGATECGVRLLVASPLEERP